MLPSLTASVDLDGVTLRWSAAPLTIGYRVERARSRNGQYRTLAQSVSAPWRDEHWPLLETVWYRIRSVYADGTVGEPSDPVAADLTILLPIVGDLTNFEGRSDRDRREHERDALDLLTRVFDTAKLHIYSALRVGADPFQAATDVLLGNPRAHPTGIAGPLAAILAAAEAEGRKRAERVTGIAGSAGEPTSFVQQAQQNAVAMLATLNRRVRDALASARNARGGAQTAVGEAFRTWGYDQRGEHGAWLLTTASENTVGAAYGAGQLRGWLDPRSGVTGLRYVSILDNRTSDICIAYDGVRLPIGHRWILSHWPLNHHRCRSMFRPLFGRFERTPEDEIPWAPPPQAGFGAAPLMAFGVPLYRAA